MRKTHPLETAGSSTGGFFFKYILSKSHFYGSSVEVQKELWGSHLNVEVSISF